MKTKILRLLICIVLLASTLTACGDFEEEDPNIDPTETASAETEATEDAGEDISSEPSEPDSASDSKADTWLVMLYQDADDSILEEDIFTDLNEAERIGSTDQVKIVAQIDRSEEGFEGEENFSTAKRFYLTQDDGLSSVNSEEIADLGEVNMASAQTLVDFVTWAVATYPSGHYILIMSDHGTGWPGGWTDSDNPSQNKNISIDGFDDMLYLDEMVAGLSDIKEQTGIEKFDILGFDACLMGSLEVYAALEPFADYAVASQETEPSMGWAYYSFLNDLVSDPSQNTAAVAKDIVKTYIVADTYIIDDAARSEYVKRTYESAEDISESSLADEETKTVTLSAVDLAKIPDLIRAVNELTGAMSKINQKVVARARSHARTFESVFGEDYPSPYLDLGNLAKLLKKESTSENIAAAVNQVKKAIDAAVIEEMHGNSKKGSTGISIYFPNSDLFVTDGSDYATYTRMASRFAQNSLWDDFLAFHYTGQEMPETIETESAPTPEAVEEEEVVAPGAGEITITPLETSSETATVDSPATLYTTISGENVSYIYLFTGLINTDGSELQVLDIDFVDSEETYEIDGMIYPDWGDTEIPIELDWTPTVYVVSDGENYELVLLEPDTFGIGSEDTVYSTDGIYQFANGDEDRYARLYFNGDGELIQVLGYSDIEPNGPMHEITPEYGDSFTVLQQWISLNEDADETILKYGSTLTFGDTPWTWEAQDAPSGEYLVGFFVDDADGNRYEEYVSITAE